MSHLYKSAYRFCTTYARLTNRLFTEINIITNSKHLKRVKLHRQCIFASREVSNTTGCFQFE